MDIEALVKTLTIWFAGFTELAGAVVVGVAAGRAILMFGRAILGLVAHRAPPGGASVAVPQEEIRLSLARSLALALEFELGADILRTVVTPTWNDILQLGAIVFLRTTLNYFLQRELDAASKREAGLLATEPSAAQRPLPGSGAPPGSERAAEQAISRS